jgi:acetyltransferase-like isoleucine patch superfamily enzyme
MHWEEVAGVGCFWLEGPVSSLHVDPTSGIATGTFVNTASGTITMEAHSFLGPWVQLLTGSHDYTKFGLERMRSTFVARNSDIIIREGVWIAGGAIVVGPCEIGEHAVIAAGAVVTGLVPAYALMRGNPAVQVKDVRWPDDPWPRA